jgi:hypothetical protein
MDIENNISTKRKHEDDERNHTNDLITAVIDS